MPDIVQESSVSSSLHKQSFFETTSIHELIVVDREDHNFVWDPIGMAWVREQQPEINASTINVAISGPVSVTGQVSILNPVSVTGEVSVKNFPATFGITGNVSVVNASAAPLFTQFNTPPHVIVDSGGPVSVVGNVSVAGNVSAAIVGAVSVTGQVSVLGNVSTDVIDRANRVLGGVSVMNAVSVTGQVSILNAVSVTGQVSVLNFPTAVSVTGQVSIVSPVSVTGQVSIVGPVSVTGQVSVLGNVSVGVVGNVSVVQSRVALTPAAPVAISVGSANTQVAASVAGRTGLVITNPTAINVYLGFNAAAVLGAGIFIAPNGVYEMDPWMFTTGSVGAIASIGAIASVGVQEFS